MHRMPSMLMNKNEKQFISWIHYVINTKYILLSSHPIRDLSLPSKWINLIEATSLEFDIDERGLYSPGDRQLEHIVNILIPFIHFTQLLMGIQFTLFDCEQINFRRSNGKGKCTK